MDAAGAPFTAISEMSEALGLDPVRQVVQEISTVDRGSYHQWMADIDTALKSRGLSGCLYSNKVNQRTRYVQRTIAGTGTADVRPLGDNVSTPRAALAEISSIFPKRACSTSIPFAVSSTKLGLIPTNLSNNLELHLKLV